MPLPSLGAAVWSLFVDEGAPLQNENSQKNTHLSVDGISL